MVQYKPTIKKLDKKPTPISPETPYSKMSQEKLIRAYQTTRSVEIEAFLIKKFSKMIHKIARNIQNKHYGAMELKKELGDKETHELFYKYGVKSLFDKINKINPDNAGWRNYIYTIIMGGIKDYLRIDARLPRSILAKIKKEEDEEGFYFVSLDKIITEDDDTLLGVISHKDAIDPLQSIIEKEEKTKISERIYWAITILPERYKKILKGLYFSYKRKKMVELGQELGISESRVSQEHKIAKELLKISMLFINNKKKYTGEIKDIINAYELYNGNVKEAASQLHYLEDTFLKLWLCCGLKTYWESPKLESRRNKRLLPMNEINNILFSYFFGKGVAIQASKYSNHSPMTVLSIWSDAGLETRTRGHLSQKEIKKIDDSYESCNGNAREAARLLGHDPETIIENWRKGGYNIKKTNVLSQEDIEMINALYELCGGNVKKAAKMVHHDRAIVSKYWREAGYEITRKGGGQLSQEQIKEVINARVTHEGNASKAARNLPYSKSTFLKYWKLEDKKTV